MKITPKETKLKKALHLDLSYSANTGVMLIITEDHQDVCSVRHAQAFNNITTQEQLITKVTEVIKNEAK